VGDGALRPIDEKKEGVGTWSRVRAAGWGLSHRKEKAGAAGHGLIRDSRSQGSGTRGTYLSGRGSGSLQLGVA
jgi:hypothetical protein